MSGAVLLGPYGLLLGAALQGAEPPPTSGNLMTIFLGLTASSFIVIVAAGASLRGLRSLRSSRLGRGTLLRPERPESAALGPRPVRNETPSSRLRAGPELGVRTDPIADDPENSGDQ